MKKATPKGDTTGTRRQSKRTAALNKIAGQAGYFHKGKGSWSTYETAVINRRVRISPK